MRRALLLSLVALFTTAATPAEDVSKRRTLEAAAEAGDHARVVALATELVASQPPISAETASIAASRTAPQ